MIARFAALFTSLTLAGILTDASALAQYYPSNPPVYRGQGPYPYRGVQPYPDDERGYFDDEDDAPMPRTPGVPRTVQQMPQQYQQAPQYQQQPQRGPQRVMPYPDEQADALPQPGFIPPEQRGPYGHQFDQRQQGNVSGTYRGPVQAQQQPQQQDDNPILRPPGIIGGAQQPQQQSRTPEPASRATLAALPAEDQPEEGPVKELPANLKKQLVDYPTSEPAGTIVIDTPHTYLYLTLGNGKAIRYGIGVGREGFTWAGTERISKMSEWPDWHPPAEMIERQPYLPRFMAGGPGNPLGARALYLGKTLYRIHGTNQPSTIGQNVSSGCIRLLNEDIEDLYSRVQPGTRVVVLPGSPPQTAQNGPAAQGGNVPATQGGPTSLTAPGQGAIQSQPLQPVRPGR
jgi:lipoprotein-anchoring transpeptidase ErfK/SrfK